MYKQGTLVSYCNKIGIVTDEITKVENTEYKTVIFENGYKNKFTSANKEVSIISNPMNDLIFENKPDKWWIRKLKYQIKKIS